MYYNMKNDARASDVFLCINIPVDEIPPQGYSNGMQEQRRAPRYQTLAHARINGVLDGENVLKNLSITGCCIEYTGVADIQPNTQYLLEIKPEKVSRIRSFQLQVEAKWIRNDNYTTEIGMSIVASPKGKQFQRYVDYLAYRHTHS